VFDADLFSRIALLHNVYSDWLSRQDLRL